MPRIWLALFVLAAVALAASPAAAQAGAGEPAVGEPAASQPATAGEPAAVPAGVEVVPVPVPPPESHMRKPERLSHRPSGFWTSNLPARGGAYRWRIMAVGGLVLAITIYFVVRLIRRTDQSRAS